VDYKQEIEGYIATLQKYQYEPELLKKKPIGLGVGWY
jgi:hypothetical protein